MSADGPDQAFDETDESQERRSSGEDDVEYERFVYCFVGDHRLAVPVEAVKAITEAPTESTRVPRAAEAIAGVTDLRGEITAIIDPRPYVPDSGEPTSEPALLVLDRPTDEQAAAVMVDDVHGVETVPERDVFETDDFDEEEVAGSALEHPLLVGVVKRTWRSHEAVREAIAERAARQAIDGVDGAHAEDIGVGDHLGAGAEMGVEVGEFSVDDESTDVDEMAAGADDWAGDASRDDDSLAADDPFETEFDEDGVAEVPGATGADFGSPFASEPTPEPATADDLGPESVSRADDPASESASATGAPRSGSASRESEDPDAEIDATPVFSIDRLLLAIDAANRLDEDGR